MKEQIPLPETNEVVPEGAIREFLESHHTINNAGTKGIIFKFTENEVPEPLRKNLFEEESADGAEPSEQSLAIKALKIYNAGDAEREFQALQKARQITEGRDDVAQTPRGISFHEIPISEEFQDFLNKNGAMVTGRKIGILIMDYIEGADLATILYREALKRVPDSQKIYPDDHIDHLSFQELHAAVSATLRFSKPGGKSRDEGERIFEEASVRSENVDKLITALQKGGFTMPQDLLDKIENTVDLWHKNGLYHNDLHERNIIIQGWGTDKAEPYGIDFGSATLGSRAPESPVSKVADDHDLIRRLAPLTEKGAEKVIGPDYWRSLFESINNNAAKYRVTEIANAVKAGNGDLEKEFTIASGSDHDLEGFLAVLFTIHERYPKYRDAVKRFVEEQSRAEDARGFVLKRMNDLGRAIENNQK